MPCFHTLYVALESHLWRGWGRQNSGRLRKREKWGTWKERNRNPPGLPNLPFSEKEKKRIRDQEKTEFLWTNKMGNCCGTEAGSKEHVYNCFFVYKNPNFRNFFKSVIWLPTERPGGQTMTIGSCDSCRSTQVENAIMKVSALVFELINILKARFFRHCFRQISGIGLAFSLVLSLVCSYRCFKDKIFDPIFNPLNDSLCFLLLWDLFPN